MGLQFMRVDEEGRKPGTMNVENEIVGDLQAIKNLEDIQVAVVRSQLKADGKQRGLLLDFAKNPSNAIGSYLLEAVPAFQPSSFGMIVQLLPESATDSKECAEAEDAGITLGFRQPSVRAQTASAAAAAKPAVVKGQRME